MRLNFAILVFLVFALTFSERAAASEGQIKTTLFAFQNICLEEFEDIKLIEKIISQYKYYEMPLSETDEYYELIKPKEGEILKIFGISENGLTIIITFSKSVLEGIEHGVCTLSTKIESPEKAIKQIENIFHLSKPKEYKEGFKKLKYYEGVFSEKEYGLGILTWPNSPDLQSFPTRKIIHINRIYPKQ